MSVEEKPLSEWARKRAAGKARRAGLIERRERYFALLLDGHSVEEIAEATTMSPAAVRRAIGQAIDARRPESPERFAKLQIARLTKALRAADVGLDRGDLKAIEPFLKVVAELDRYHGLPAGPMRLKRSTHSGEQPGAAAAARKSCAREAISL